MMSTPAPCDSPPLPRRVGPCSRPPPVPGGTLLLIPLRVLSFAGDSMMPLFRRLLHTRARRLRPGRLTLRVEELEGRLVPALLGNQLFPSDSPWNQPITAAPVAANSAAIIGNIVGRYGNGRLHPD